MFFNNLLKALFTDKFLIFLLILFLIPLLYLCFYIHPSADDFVYGSWYKNVNHTSFFEYHRQNYLTWNGRYFSTLLLSINPLVFKCLTGYKLIPLFLISFFYFGFFLMLSQIFKQLGKKTIHIIALLILLIYLNLVPSLPETLYWMSASMTYFMAWGLTFYWFYFLISYYKKPSFKNSIMPLILMICIIGTNELSAFMTFFVLLFVAIREIIQDKKLHTGTIFFLIICVVFLFIVIIAPGNAVRQTNYPNHHNLMYALSNASFNLFRIYTLIFISTPFIFFLLLTALNSNEFYEKLNINKNTHIFWTIVLYPIPIMLVFFFYFVSSFSMGIHPPLRVHGFIAFFILFYVMVLLIKIFGKMIFFNFEKSNLKKINIILIILLLFSIMADFHKKTGDNIYFKGNIMQATYDICNEVEAYNKEMNDRYKIIEYAQKDNVNNISVPELKHRPQSIFFVDIKPDSTYWVNWATALYFDIETIKTKN